MPYIVTTTREHEAGAGLESQHAVATLDEAREVAETAVNNAHDWGELLGDDGGCFTHALHLPESGGIIGPLPDGTVIEVRHAEWAELRQAVGIVGRHGASNDPAQFARADRILDAFNAR